MIKKFRAWEEEGKEMFRVVGVYFPHENSKSKDIIVNGRGGSANIKPEHLMQFTGLLDKNGKEIYEGDIVKYERYDKIIIASIEWREGEGCYHYLNLEDSVNSDSMISESMFFVGTKDVEIIGNIYENPKLLTKLSTENVA